MNKFFNAIAATAAVLCITVSNINAQDLQADNMLLFQRPSGGWSKQFKGKAFSYNVQFSDEQKREIAGEAARDDANIDNESTKKEIRYLVKAYQTSHNAQYLKAVEKGIAYLLKAQYENGGFPQYFPKRDSYRGQVTYNDNAMINALNVLQDVGKIQNGFDIVNPELVKPSLDAVQRGIQCILKTQIKVNGKLTGWCQQYDETTLQAAKARAYELPSISSSESVSIVRFLMSQPNPTPEIISAVKGAVEWLDRSKITGYKIARLPSLEQGGKYDRQLVPADNAPALWSRYYEIDSNKPFFSDRDGVKKYSIADIGYERRNGYAWYGEWANALLEREYPAWLAKWNIAK